MIETSRMLLTPIAPLDSKPRRRRNPRPINSCTECRLRKAKCSRSYPCQNCTLFKRECIFISGAKVKNSERTNSGTLDAAQADPERPYETAQTPPRDFEWEMYLEERSPENDPWDNLVAEPEAIHHSTSLDDDDDSTTTANATIRTLQIGKMSISQCTRGLFHPGLVQELEALLSSDGNIRSATAGSFADHFTKPVETGMDLFSGSDHFLTTEVILPLRFEGEIFYQQYLHSVDPIAHILHISSFKRMFDSFWNNFDAHIPNSGPRTALMLAVCMAAAASMSSLQAQTQFGTSQEGLYSQLKLSTEAAFKKWNCLSSSSLQSIQALTIYLVTECRGNVTRSHSVLVGALIRLAQCVGMHRDDTTKGLSPRQRHARGLLWYHICVLDVKTSDSQGPQTTLRPGDFDIPMPRNIDDATMDVCDSPPQPENGWTDTSFSLLHFELSELHSTIIRGRIAVGRAQMTLHELRREVEFKKAAVKTRYLTHLDIRVPIQRYAQLVASLMLAQCDIMIMFRYLSKRGRDQSQNQLRDILVKAALTVAESGAAIENTPTLHPFAWYASAYQQYHSVFLLLVEMYRDPSLKDSSRIQKVIDDTFGPCYGMDLAQRCGELLWRIKEGLGLLYHAPKTFRPQEPTLSTHLHDFSTSTIMDAPMQLSDLDLEDLFNSFQGGHYDANDTAMSGSTGDQRNINFDMDSSFLQSRGMPHNEGFEPDVTNMSYPT